MENMAGWPSGWAEVCRISQMGSTPIPASNILSKEKKTDLVNWQNWFFLQRNSLVNIKIDE